MVLYAYEYKYMRGRLIPQYANRYLVAAIATLGIFNKYIYLKI